jgi:hypothetical protein
MKNNIKTNKLFKRENQYTNILKSFKFLFICILILCILIIIPLLIYYEIFYLSFLIKEDFQIQIYIYNKINYLLRNFLYNESFSNINELTLNKNHNENIKIKNFFEKFLYLFDPSNKYSYPSKFQNPSFIKDNSMIINLNKLYLIQLNKINIHYLFTHLVENNYELKSILPSLDQLKEMQNIKGNILNLSLSEQLNTIEKELNLYEIQREKFIKIIYNIENNKEEFFPNESKNLFEEYIILIDHLIDDLKSRANNINSEINNNK